jgi:uncharacterized repeat protein (TIGR01451 family)
MLVLAFLIAGLPHSALAIDLPPNNTALYIQTSGPNARLNIGDFYTNSQGENDPNGHSLQINVPCDWQQGKPITFALFDPEVALPNPSGITSAIDEIRDAGQNNSNSNANSSNTSFTLKAPGGAAVSATYTPNGGTNGRWVELATFDVPAAGYGCGMYTINTTTGGNDDNAWLLRVVYDPDCTVSPGTCSSVNTGSVLLNNGNEQDDSDGVLHSGDEIVAGVLRTSFQQYDKPLNTNPNVPPPSAACQTFYYFVDESSSETTFHNFDMDGDIAGGESIEYFPPATSTRYASPTPGTVSSNALWNNPPTPATDANGVPLRGGDRFVIGPEEAGWWRIRACVEFPEPLNQYVLEGEGPLYFTPPPQPVMELTKTDGVLVAQRGQQLDYTLTFKNSSDTTATPGGAVDVTLTDTLPTNTTYLSCAINAPYTGTCSNNGGVVAFALDQPVAAGATGSVRVSVRVNNDAVARVENNAQLDYKDVIGNTYPSVFTQDIDTIPSSVPPNNISLSSFTAAYGADGVALSWTTTAEIGTAGFHLLRSATGTRAGAVQVTPSLIQASGHMQGASYTWSDTGAIPGQRYTYWLVEYEHNGKTAEYGPAVQSGLVSVGYRILLPIVSQ